jgi:sugar O-acyltransferase (sialic acid O-acetyltransferase NeuD family)
MNKIAIFGAGGLGREISVLLKQINDQASRWEVIGFYDDGKKPGEIVDGLTVLGGIDELQRIEYDLNLVIAIADVNIRKKIATSLSHSKVRFPSLIHPSVDTKYALTAIGNGCVITAGCVLTTNIVLGEFVILNIGSTIGHDVTIGSYVIVMPGVNISGFVKIGEGTVIGTGAAILQHISIGETATVGAGAVVIKNVKPNTTVVGVPAEAK